MKFLRLDALIPIAAKPANIPMIIATIIIKVCSVNFALFTSWLVCLDKLESSCFKSQSNLMNRLSKNMFIVSMNQLKFVRIY